MIIKPTSKRIEFERLLRKIGYHDQSPVVLNIEKLKKQVNYICQSGAMAIYSFIIFYPNKKSYLYLEFIDNYNSDNLERKIRTLAKRIKYEEKSRIAEIGWEVVYSKHPKEFSLEERKAIFFQFIKSAHKNLKEGLFGLNPKPKDVIISKPHGPKLDQGFTTTSIITGSKQRGIIAKKFGFGNIYDDGFQYARYNDDLKIKPI
jgi:hypothetical protein